MSTLRHWLIMGVLSFSGGIVFMLPFLQEVYYIPLAQALDLNNTQVGSLMSVFGMTAMLSYFPGGWLADRVSPRKLIKMSLLSTGAAGHCYFFLITAGICGVGLVASLIIYFNIVNKRSGETQA